MQLPNNQRQQAAGRSRQMRETAFPRTPKLVQVLNNMGPVFGLRQDTFEKLRKSIRATLDGARMVGLMRPPFPCT
eukprot:14107900-Alexandrium_andersonii.AAC.1